MRGDFSPPGDAWQRLGTFFIVTTERVASGIEWVELRDAAKHPAVPANPSTKNDPARNVDSAETVRPWSGLPNKK